ncbi:hypothetical protein P7C70_g2518, partial [Phenoliferia sp. Uapishka_3]
MADPSSVRRETVSALPKMDPIVEDHASGAPIQAKSSYDAGFHHYLLCLSADMLGTALQDPEDTDASKKALEYTKSRLAQAGDLVVLLSILEHPLVFPADGWSSAGISSYVESSTSIAASYS